MHRFVQNAAARPLTQTKKRDQTRCQLFLEQILRSYSLRLKHLMALDYISELLSSYQPAVWDPQTGTSWFFLMRGWQKGRAFSVRVPLLSNDLHENLRLQNHPVKLPLKAFSYSIYSLIYSLIYTVCKYICGNVCVYRILHVYLVFYSVICSFYDCSC